MPNQWDDPSQHDIPRPTEAAELEINLAPDYEVTAEWFARALREHSFERNAKEPVISLIEQIRYLTQTNPEAVARIIERLR